MENKIKYTQINNTIANINLNGAPIGLVEKLISKEYMIELFGIDEPFFLDVKHKKVISKFIGKIYEMSNNSPFTIGKNLHKLRPYKEFKTIA